MTPGSLGHADNQQALPLRMRQHCANAIAVAKHLKEHPKVTKIIFAGAISGEAKRRADAYLKGGYGGLLGFELKGGHPSSLHHPLAALT